MKQLIKLAALLLSVLMLLTLVSCRTDKEEGIPDGMQTATAAGADFRLYIPTTWQVNTAYGVSGGYFKLSEQSTVSAQKYPIGEELAIRLPAEGAQARIDYFWNETCKPVMVEQCLNGHFTVDSFSEPTTLDGINAYRYVSSGIVNDHDLHFIQVVTEKSQAFYVISFVISDELYEGLKDDVEKILKEFVFGIPYNPDGFVKSFDDLDVEIPSGMKLASNDDVAYRFFVPEEWKINQNERIFSAYWESDRSNVSVIPYMPAYTMSVPDFFEASKEMMIEISGEDGFELFEEADVKLGGKNARAYTYRFRVDGRDFYYMQVIVPYKSMIYSMTYTAPSPEAFAAHLGDVERMIDAFTFR